MSFKKLKKKRVIVINIIGGIVGADHILQIIYTKYRFNSLMPPSGAFSGSGERPSSVK